jgi:hypothetical protein
VIARLEVPALLLEASPSFAVPYAEHVAEHGTDLLYVAAGDLARTLLKLSREGVDSEIAAVAAVIERLHKEGTPWVQEFATIGVLEGILTVWSHEDDSDLSTFARFLGPESRRWWNRLVAEQE